MILSNRNYFFWILASIVVILRLIVSSDLGIQPVYAPHDELLYVLRAYHLITDGSMGAYDSRTLVKLPGFSFLLAGIRLTGLPYLQSILIFQAFAGLYFLSILRRSNVPYSLLITAFALYMINPVSFDGQSFRVLREPVALAFQVFILSAMGHIYWYINSGKLAWLHIFVLAIASSFLLLIREEDMIFFGVLVVYAIVIFLKVRIRLNLSIIDSVKKLSLILSIVFLVIFSLNGLVRLYTYNIYGAPILHDFGEGEYPRMLAALRSVDSQKDNRLVMPTQEVLSKVALVIPEFAPLVSKLPRPGSGTYSCTRFGVCSEWTSGWMFFWIKDAAFELGNTPDLLASQAYFKKIRMGIEIACQDGRLKCTSRGSGMFPPFELRWTRALLHEIFNIIGMMWHPPFSDPAFPQVATVDELTSKLYKMVTMTSYDSEVPTIIGAQSKVDELQGVFKSPLHQLKYEVKNIFDVLGSSLLLFGLISFFYLLWNFPSNIDSQLILILSFMATIYATIRVLSLAYISIYMGTLDPRLFFSTYVIAMMLALPLIFIAFKHLQANRF